MDSQFTAMELSLLRRLIRAHMSECGDKELHGTLNTMYDKVLKLVPMAEEPGVLDLSAEVIDLGSEEVSCDGHCEGKCAFCRRQADIAAENEVIEMGY
jgi:hypothetical protein